jgi:hypothetical protein
MASLFDLGSKIAKNPQNFVNNLPGGSDIRSVAGKAIGPVLDASANRLFSAGLNFAGANLPDFFGGFTSQFRTQDNRVRLALSPGSGPMLYKDPNNSVLSPLVGTGGVLFPYTPTISISHSAQYSGQQPTHSNYVQHSYNASAVDSITVDGYFTANDPEEAQYVMAVIHFLRSAYKMFFGNDRLAGTPPPVLRLSGHGSLNYNSVPVVLQNFAEIMPADRDYIEVPGTKTLIPTYMPVTLQLLPIYSKNQIGNFNLDSFARGDMIGSSNGGGGMI